MKFNPKLFKNHLREAEILIPTEQIKGSVTYLPYGLKIRHKIYSLGIDLLKQQNFLEINLSDIIQKDDVAKLDSIAVVSNNFFHISKTERVMAAGHEIPFYIFLRSFLKHNNYPIFPIKYFHFGSVFRYAKNTKFPFNLGERRSFLECYISYKYDESHEKYFNSATQWNREFITKILHIPSVEVERPLTTNKPFSLQTTCIDAITPLGITAITGMTYRHDDIFSKIFNVKYKDRFTNKNKLIKTIHFGVSDNLFFSYLLNSHDGRGFRMLNNLAPSLVSIIIDTRLVNASNNLDIITKYLSSRKYSFKFNFIPSNKIERHVNLNIIKGIPVTITITKKNSLIKSSFIYRGDPIARDFNHNHIHIIDTLLTRNNSEIINNFRKIKLSNVVNCTSIKEVNSNLSKGKVCKVYMKKTPKNITKFESQLNSGEILGFSHTNIKGLCINTRIYIRTLAYISKRS